MSDSLWLAVSVRTYRHSCAQRGRTRIHTDAAATAPWTHTVVYTGEVGGEVGRMRLPRAKPRMKKGIQGSTFVKPKVANIEFIHSINELAAAPQPLPPPEPQGAAEEHRKTWRTG